MIAGEGMTATPASAVGGLPPGTKLGRYQVLQRIALGGMAELYLARQRADAGFTKLVALKRVLPHLAEDAEFVSMFLNEAKLASSLEHPNIASVTDFGQAGRDFFMVLEYVHGRGVNELLRTAAKAQGVPLDCALSIVTAVAGALHHAHEACDAEGAPLGLVHRDVSPSNILVSYDGAVKLVDFGIAKATSQAQATRSQAIKGKLAYMSPEQARGSALDRTADVFSLGVVLYELTTGRRCFFAEGEFALLNKVAEGKYLAPHKIVPSYPQGLAAIVNRALEVEPAARFPTARAFQTALEDFAASQGTRLSTLALADFVTDLFGATPYPTTSVLPLLADATETSRSAPKTRIRRRAGWIGGAVLGITVGVAVGAALMRGQQDPPTPTPAPVPPPALVADPTPSPAVEPPTEDDVEFLPEEPEKLPGRLQQEEQATPPRPKGKRAKKRGRRRRSSRPAADSPDVPSEFLPPSHRESRGTPVP
ncbi:MAG: serine/threonine-protein kinase [Nannocystales bacterium]